MLGSSGTEVLVRARGLTKKFGSFTAVDGIDFDLYRGEAFGFLGPNGAGKSSTMRMIGCVSPPTSGELAILGADPVRNGSAIRARLGVVPQEDTLDVELTVRENLLVYGRYFGLPRRVIRERTAALLEFVQLADRANSKVDPLSGGLKRRLTIARSLINEPEILRSPKPPLAVRAFQCWLTVYRRIWRSSIWSSVLGPICYLGALGFGLGSLVDKHSTASLGGVSYLAFVAPAILATGAMNTAMGEASYPVFGSIKWNRIYIGAQASPLRPGDIFRGHLMFMAMRIAMNAAVVIVVMWAFGAIRSAWVVLAYPVAVLIGFAFAAIGMTGTTYMKSWQDFDYVILASMPLFLFSATFYPLSVYPRAAQVVIEYTPLYQGVVLLRDLTVGVVGPDLLWRAAYLAVCGLAGLYASGRRIGKLLLV